MFQRNKVDLDWSTFFNLTKEEKESFLKEFKLTDVEHFTWEQYKHLFDFKWCSKIDEVYETAFKIEILSFCIEEANFAADVLTEEDFLKCSELFKRKQYDSKLLKYLLNVFLCFLSYHKQKQVAEKLLQYLERDVKKRFNGLQEQKVEKTFMPLKKQIEKIAAGVKGYCYLSVENPRDYGVRIDIDSKIKTELNEYLKEKYSYDYNALNENWRLRSLALLGNHADDINRIFQLALYNDNAFWEQHEKFNIISFIEVVYDVNDSRHAEKILDYIFDNILNKPHGKEIIEKSLPLISLKKEEFLYGLEERTFRFTFDRFKKCSNLQTLSEANLCYPLSDVSDADKKLCQGKQLVEELLSEIYPDDVDCVMGILKSEIDAPSSAFSVRKQALSDVKGKIVDSVRNHDDWTIRHIFDFPTFGYHDKVVDKEVVSVYCPEYFSAQNIWNRFYLKAFYMFKLVKDKKTCFTYLFEVFYDLFQFIEKKTGIRTSYQRNLEGRDETYAKLKAILKQHNIEISDKYKSDYIISLLDRKVAIREESERFPVLEQLGDAIYGLAVAEMLFYASESQPENIAETFEHFTCAKSQIKVAEKIGVDKLYLSSSSLPGKYASDILINPDSESYVIEQEREQLENDKKYIADSLEMIIGTVCEDCGYKIAISFTKELIRKAYPATIPFMREAHWEDKPYTNIDKDYWTRILPSPYTHFDDSHDVLWRAFDKFFKAYVLGTEDKTKRQFITNSLGDNKLYDNIGGYREVNQVFYEYLHFGLESSIEKFSKIVIENYKKFKI